MADNIGGFQTPLSSMRFQSQLGKEHERRYKEGENALRLSIAEVVKVNYKYNTVDVVTKLYKNSTVRNPINNGKFSAKLPISFGGRTPEGHPYGTNTLVSVGSLVLIGFIEGDKDYPVVLNIYGDVDNQSQLTQTTFTSAEESDEFIQREVWKLFTLYPSLTYESTDGRGSKEVTLPGRTFLYVTDTDPENAYVRDTGFDYEHLPSSRYSSGDAIEPKSPQTPTLLYVHQGVYDKHRVTFFIKSDGTLRIGSRHLDGNGITFQELTPNGKINLEQRKGTISPELDFEREKFSKMSIEDDGTVILKSQNHTITLTNENIFVNSINLLEWIDWVNNYLYSLDERVTNLERKVADLQNYVSSINARVVEIEDMLNI